MEIFLSEELPEDSPHLEAIRNLLLYFGENPYREGLIETPGRVLKAYKEMLSGYGQDPASVMKAFEETKYNQMIVLRDVFFTSICEHHLVNFTGFAHIGYIPNGKIIGISKLVRLVEIFSRRLQVQERLTQQIASSLMKYLQPLGAACAIEARHQCMVCRGVRQQSATMITSSIEGVFVEPAVRAEFLSFLNKKMEF